MEFPIKFMFILADYKWEKKAFSHFDPERKMEYKTLKAEYISSINLKFHQSRYSNSHER